MITIIMRAYNNEQFIQRPIESALSQTCPDYELLVVNDGSTDKTKEILETFRHPKIRILNQKNQGMIAAGYAGLRAAEGDFVIFLDADDLFKAETLSELSQAIHQDKNSAFAYGDYEEIDLRNNHKKIVSCRNILNVLACGVLFKKSALLDVGFWDASLIFPEHDLMLRLSKKYSGVHIAKPLYVYHRHAGSFTAHAEKISQGLQQLAARYGPLEFKEY